ncbi:hypothetical protein LZ554_008766 [Drepanopeziza brunnea f. sp. 'monogermtubi']|nr:hypothetical protein LZ554_008766 [Drepanopeziza brunnea f. sp. 'monogermtubi']
MLQAPLGDQRELSENIKMLNLLASTYQNRWLNTQDGFHTIKLLSEAPTPKRSTVSGVLQIADANTSFGAIAPNSAPSPSMRSFARMSGFPSYATHQNARLRAPVKKADKKKANLELEDADIQLQSTGGNRCHLH